MTFAAVGSPHPSVPSCPITLARLSGRLAVLLAIYAVLDWWCLGAARLPEAAYERPVLLVELFRHLVPSGGAGVVAGARLLLGLAVGVAVVRTLRVRWADLASSSGEWTVRVRVLVAVTASILTWAFATYDYNAYYDRLHLFDRLLLVALAAGVAWRPGFVLPLVLHVVTIVWQFAHPIGPYSVAEPFMLVRVLLLFVAALVVFRVTGRFWRAELVFLVLTLVAASYLKCGVGKMALDHASHGAFNWLTHGHIYLLLFATHAGGWLGGADIERVTDFARVLAALDGPMVIGTAVLEGAVFLVFWRRRLALVFLAGWILFHVAVFAVSGICFWKWVVLDATLIAVLWSPRASASLGIFRPTYALLAVPVLIGGLFWYRPVSLGWYDSPLGYTYRFEGVTADGTHCAMDPSYFAPYDYAFTLRPFHYLSHEPGFDLAWGAIWDREIADSLLAARSVADVERLEASHGAVAFDRAKVEAFDAFVTRFVATKSRRPHGPNLPFPLRAPRQLWTSDSAQPCTHDAPIERVVARQVSSFFDGERYHEFRSREVRVIEISR